MCTGSIINPLNLIIFSQRNQEQFTKSDCIIIIIIIIIIDVVVILLYLLFAL